jgi:hypothetical protein
MARGLAALPVAADGATHPEIIPMDIAYRHFIRSVAVHEKEATPGLKARRDEVFRQIGFRDPAAAAVQSALRGVREQLDQIQRLRADRGARAFSTATTGHSEALARAEREVLDAAAERLQNSVDAETKAQVDSYVRLQVRRRIIIYGSLPQ